MIQPGHGTVLYNKGLLHLACVARAERVDFKICTQNSTVIAQDVMDKGASVDGWDYHIFYKEIAVSSLIPDTDYYVTYWYEDSSTSEHTVIFNAFVYRPNPSIYPIDVTLDSQDLDVKQVNTYNIQLIEK